MTFKLEVVIGGDAMQNPSDLYRVITEVSRQVLMAKRANDKFEAGEEQEVVNVMGVKVGKWEITE